MKAAETPNQCGSSSPSNCATRVASRRVCIADLAREAARRLPRQSSTTLAAEQTVR